MKIVSLITARGGSKEIPMKNISWAQVTSLGVGVAQFRADRCRRAAGGRLSLTAIDCQRLSFLKALHRNLAVIFCPNDSVAPGLGALPEADGANQTGKSGGGAHLAGGSGAILQRHFLTLTPYRYSPFIFFLHINETGVRLNDPTDLV